MLAGRLEEDAKDGSHEVTHMKEALSDGLELEVGARIAKPETNDEIRCHLSRRLNFTASELSKLPSKDSACNHRELPLLPSSMQNSSHTHYWEQRHSSSRLENRAQPHPTSSSWLSVDQVGRPAVMRKECCTLYLPALSRTSDGTRSRTLPIPTRGRFFRVLRPLRDRHCASCGGMVGEAPSMITMEAFLALAESLANDFEVVWQRLIVKSRLQVDGLRKVFAARLKC